MKKMHLLIAGLMTAILFSGCVKDVVKRQYTFYRPMYATKASVRANIKSNPERPMQNPGKLFYKDGYVFMSDLDKGVHVIDIRNTSAPRRVGFVDIPGCVDLAVRGNILYADMYTDLVAINISNPAQVKLEKVVEGVFPERQYGHFAPDRDMIITSWVRVDTVVTELDYAKGWGIAEGDFFAMTAQNGSNRGSGSNANGTGGSMARFALIGNRMYTVDSRDLRVFDVTKAEDPSFRSTQHIGQGWGIETISPYKENLFVGSQVGMYIISAADPDKPKLLGKFEHAMVCDPVVANDDYAFVTLRDGTECRGFINQMDVLDIKNLMAPKLLSSFPLVNPHGLSNDGNIVLVCDGRAGLKSLDVTNPKAVKIMGSLPMDGAYDVIALGQVAIVVAEKGVHLVDYRNPSNLSLLSSLTITVK